MRITSNIYLLFFIIIKYYTIQYTTHTYEYIHMQSNRTAIVTAQKYRRQSTLFTSVSHREGSTYFEWGRRRKPVAVVFSTEFSSRRPVWFSRFPGSSTWPDCLARHVTGFPPPIDTWRRENRRVEKKAIRVAKRTPPLSPTPTRDQNKYIIKNKSPPDTKWIIPRLLTFDLSFFFQSEF